MHRALWVFVLGCVNGGVAIDAGEPDGSPIDASVFDASPSDAGAFDAGAVDAWTFDAAPLDAALDAAPLDASDPWTGTPCRVSGVDGVCREVSACEGVATPGFCPGPASIQCCTPRRADAGTSDAATLACDPDARPQPNVGLVEEPGVGGCPAGMVRVADFSSGSAGSAADFCIDRFEASLAEVLPDGGLVPWSPYFHPGRARVRALSLRGAVPQGYVDGRTAAQACAEAGKRLCTDAEWLRACQGSSGTTYPYGATREPGRCNDARSMHPAIEYFGTSADWIWSELDHPCLNQLPASLAPTGAFEGCVSAEGALDLMGNLHEWTADPDGTFRGGFYVDTVRNGPGCLYRTTAHDMGHFDYSTGFRCCAD